MKEADSESAILRREGRLSGEERRARRADYLPAGYYRVYLAYPATYLEHNIHSCIF